MKIRINVDEVLDVLRNCDDFEVDNEFSESGKFNEGGRIRELWSDENVCESVGIDEMVDDLNTVYFWKEGFYFRGEWSCVDEIDDKDREIFEREVDFSE